MDCHACKKWATISQNEWQNSRKLRLYLDQGFGEGNGNGNGNGNGRGYNHLGPLDHLPFSFPFHFPSLNPWSKNNLNDFDI